MLKKYEKLDKIGQGSFGKVFKVRSRKTRQILVLKEIDLSSMGPKTRRDAENEVKILKTITHRHIVGFVEAFKQSGKLFIITEYCEKGDLGQYIRRQSRLIDEETVMKIFVQICLGLNHLHDENILHRDIKAMNIFLKKNFEVRIGDLGVAKILKEQYDFANTVIGTPYYLSPELCAEKPYNEKNDVWALGCLLYEMCKQTQPFKGSHAHKLKEAIKERDYADISTKYSSRLKLLIRLMLCKDAEKRPSMKEILEEPFVQTKIEQVEAEWEKKKIGRFQVVQKFNNEFGYAKKLRQQRMDNMKSVGRKRNFKKNKAQKPKVEYDDNGRKNMLDELMKGKQVSHLLKDADQLVGKSERENNLTKGNNNKNPYFRRASHKNQERAAKNGRNSRQNNEVHKGRDEEAGSNVRNAYPPKRVVKSKRVIAKVHNAGDAPSKPNRRGVRSGANSPGPERAGRPFLKRKAKPQKAIRGKNSRQGSKGRGSRSNNRRKSSANRNPIHNGYDINRDIYIQEVMKNFGGNAGKLGRNINQKRKQKGLKMEKNAKRHMMDEMEDLYFNNMGFGGEKQDRLDAFFGEKQGSSRHVAESSNYKNHAKDKKRDREIFGEQNRSGSSGGDDEFAFSYSNNFEAVMKSRRNAKRSSRRVVSRPESNKEIQQAFDSKRNINKRGSKSQFNKKPSVFERKGKRVKRQKTYPVKMNKSGLLRNRHNKKKIERNIMNKSCNVRDHYSPGEEPNDEPEFKKAKLPFENNEPDVGGPECNPLNYIMNATGELVLRPDYLKVNSRGLTRSVILKNLQVVRQNSESDLRKEVGKIIKNHDMPNSKLTPIVQAEEPDYEDKGSGSQTPNHFQPQNHPRVANGLQLIKKKDLSRLNQKARNKSEMRADSEETKMPKQLNLREMGPRHEKKDFDKWYSEEYFKECLEEDGEILAQDGPRRRSDMPHRVQLAPVERRDHREPTVDNPEIRGREHPHIQPEEPVSQEGDNLNSPSSLRSRTPDSISKPEEPRSRYISSNQKLHPSFSCGYTVSNKRNFFGRKIQRVIKKKREASPNERIKRQRLFNLDKRRKGSDIWAEETGFMDKFQEALRQHGRGGEQRVAVAQSNLRVKSVCSLEGLKAQRQFDLRAMGEIQKLRNVYVDMAMTGIRKFSIDQQNQKFSGSSENVNQESSNIILYFTLPKSIYQLF